MATRHAIGKSAKKSKNIQRSHPVTNNAKNYENSDVKSNDLLCKNPSKNTQKMQLNGAQSLAIIAQAILMKNMTLNIRIPDTIIIQRNKPVYRIYFASKIIVDEATTEHVQSIFNQNGNKTGLYYSIEGSSKLIAYEDINLISDGVVQDYFLQCNLNKSGLPTVKPCSLELSQSENGKKEFSTYFYDLHEDSCEGQEGSIQRRAPCLDHGLNEHMLAISRIIVDIIQSCLSRRVSSLIVCFISEINGNLWLSNIPVVTLADHAMSSIARGQGKSKQSKKRQEKVHITSIVSSGAKGHNSKSVGLPIIDPRKAEDDQTCATDDKMFEEARAQFTKSQSDARMSFITRVKEMDALVQREGDEMTDRLQMPSREEYIYREYSRSSSNRDARSHGTNAGKPITSKEPDLSQSPAYRASLKRLKESQERRLQEWSRAKEEEVNNFTAANKPGDSFQYGGKGNQPVTIPYVPQKLSTSKLLKSKDLVDTLRRAGYRFETEYSTAELNPELHPSEFDSVHTEIEEAHRVIMKDDYDEFQRRLFEQRTNAALTLQKFFRNQVKGMILARLFRKAMALRNASASKIQNCLRCFLSREHYRIAMNVRQRRRRLAATRIQRGYRLSTFLKYMLFLRQTYAATKFQSVIRMHLQIQRSRLVRESFLRLHSKCATRIQTKWREFYAVHMIHMQKLYRLAALQIQRIYRGWRARCIVKNLHEWEMAASNEKRFETGMQRIEALHSWLTDQENQINELHHEQELLEKQIYRLSATIHELRKRSAILVYELEEKLALITNKRALEPPECVALRNKITKMGREVESKVSYLRSIRSHIRELEDFRASKEALVNRYRMNLLSQLEAHSTATELMFPTRKPDVYIENKDVRTDRIISTNATQISNLDPVFLQAELLLKSRFTWSTIFFLRSVHGTKQHKKIQSKNLLTNGQHTKQLTLE